MRQTIEWSIKALKLMRHPKLYANIVCRHIIDDLQLVRFWLKLKIEYHGRITYDLLRKFKWRHIIQLTSLNRWISHDEYLDLCKSIFKCDLDYLKSKKLAKICFVMYADASWGGEELYRLLDKDKRFSVCVLVVRCPSHHNWSYEKIRSFYVNKGYRTYEVKDQGWKGSDIFIYQSPYHLPTKEINVDERKLNELCIMLPYAILQGDKEIEHFEGDSYRNFRGLWRYYCYTDYIFQYGLKNHRLGCVNMKFSGYPKMDTLFGEIKNQPEWRGDGMWKILFAPTAVTGNYSLFMDIWKVMLQIAQEEKTISWIFRPHPLLGFTLINTHQLDNIEEYEEYLEQWRKLPNAFVQIGGDYVDAFKTSDAMIGDGITFLTTYQYVHKPLLFLRGGKDHNLSPYGRELYDCLYICDGDYKNEVRRFIREVVKQGKDVLRQKREEFFDKNLDYKKRNGVLASEFIYEDLCKSIYGNGVKSEEKFEQDMI